MASNPSSPLRPVPELTDAEVAFASRPPLPEREEIPREFWNRNHPLSQVASSLFFNGGRLSDHGLVPREGVDVGKAMRVIRACLSSFQPQHEHKTAGVAFLLHEWFEKGEAPKPEPRQSHKAAARRARA